MFNMFKESMSSCPVLALPDFGQPFILECDASREGIRVVLMQKGHPITFKSQKLPDTRKFYSIYDKRMLAIMHALAKFQTIFGWKQVHSQDKPQQPTSFLGAKGS